MALEHDIIARTTEPHDFQIQPGPILIVDDEPVFVDLISSILCASGYQCVGVHSAREALKRAMEHPQPAVALVDLKLPDCEGTILIRQLRLQIPKLPVLAISGSEIPEHAKEARAAGALEFLAKPFNCEELLALLAHHRLTPQALNTAG